MEAKKKRNIKSGSEYERFFPGSGNNTATVRRNANVYHTVNFIPKVVHETLDQTKAISKLLKASSTYETCRNIWHFVYAHINYKKDQEGFEQIRSPARTWHDRKQGVDCDCYTVFISSILTNLGIPHILRITKYHRDYFQHIYPVVLASARTSLEQREIVIDCVTDQFDYEVPYSEKRDYPMDLQYLNGFDGEDVGELGKIFKRKLVAKTKKLPVAIPTTNPIQRTAPVPTKKAMPALLQKLKSKAASLPTPISPAASPLPAPAVKKKKKGILKKVLNVVNKVNPATLLLRNGILAAMKLNIKNVAARLRWSYLTPAQAAAKDIDPVKFQKLVATRQKLEKIFYGAGGKEENLKKAILGGKGNKDKAVSGLGMLPLLAGSEYMNEHTPLAQLLGTDIYYSENIEGMEGFRGFGELGEPVTLTSIGAAMGVVAGIVAALKQIGDIFKKKQPGSQDFDESKTDAPENNVNVQPTSSPVPLPSTATNPILPTIHPTTILKESIPGASVPALHNPIVRTDENTMPSTAPSSEASVTDEQVEPGPSPATPTNTYTTSSPENSSTPSSKESLWDKHKSWIKPVAIGVGGLTLVAIGIKLMTNKKTQHKSLSNAQSLSGTPNKKKNHPRKNKRKHEKKKAIALL